MTLSSAISASQLCANDFSAMKKKAVAKMKGTIFFMLENFTQDMAFHGLSKFLGLVP